MRQGLRMWLLIAVVLALGSPASAQTIPSMGGGGVTNPLTLGTPQSSTGKITLTNPANANLTSIQAGTAGSGLTWTLPTADSTGTQCMTSNGSGVLSWGACSAGTGTPGGSTTELQFNSVGTFGGSPNLTWATPALTIGAGTSATGQLKLANATNTNILTLQPGVTGSALTFTLPIADGSANQPLVTSGAGVLSFSAISLTGAGITGILGAANGGTANGFTAFTGPTTSTKTFTLPDSSATVLTTAAIVTAAQGGTGNGFFGVSGPATSTKTFTFPNASALVLTDATAVTAAQGGTGQASYAVGDLLYASGATALSKLADVATGNALISGGVTTAPLWGKIGLTTHVSGTLPVANGGTGVTDLTFAGATHAVATVSGVLTNGNCVTIDASANLVDAGAPCGSGGGSSAFNALTTGTNTAATMTVGTGATLTFSGSGVVNASQVKGNATVAAADGGTGQSSYTVGDTLYASGSAALSKLAAVASGNVLLSSGVSTAPTWGKVDLTAAVIGTLPAANGGTGFTDLTLSGNTHKAVTTTGTLTNNNCAKWDVNGNLIDAGATCGSGGGSSAGADGDVQIGNGASGFVVDTGVFTFDRTNHVLAGAFGVAPNLVTKTTTYTATQRDYVILGDPTSGGFTVTLPAANARGGLVYQVKNVGSANNLTIARAGADTIEADTTVVLPPGFGVTFVADGVSAWRLF